MEHLSPPAWLDLAMQKIKAHRVEEGMTLLHENLWELRKSLSPDMWKAFSQNVCREHPIRDLLHRDPFTRRSYERPRGYAGDAELLDYLYEEGGYADCDIGKLVHQFMTAQPSARSVRERRQLLARLIDETADRVPESHMLSVACGHLREAELSKAVKDGRVGKFIALDQDPESLASIQKSLPYPGVIAQQGSVRNLLTGKLTFSEMDLVYSAGLYDYLAEPVARRLTKIMFDMLRSGGQLLVANFAEHPPESGYMETFMDWWLIHRGQREMMALVAEVPRAQLAATSIFHDSERNVIYLLLTRR